MHTLLACTLALLSLQFSALAEPLKRKNTVKCYQCAYSPPRVVEEKVRVPLEDAYGKIYYKTKYVQRKAPGGWDKCQGPFDEFTADTYGIDSWECDSNCFTRADRNGNVIRGCYRGEFGVDPNRLKCSVQAGSLYCFCDKDMCNNQKADAYPDDGEYLIEDFQHPN